MNNLCYMGAGCLGCSFCDEEKAELSVDRQVSFTLADFLNDPKKNKLHSANKKK